MHHDSRQRDNIGYIVKQAVNDIHIFAKAVFEFIIFFLNIATMRLEMYVFHQINKMLAK